MFTSFVSQTHGISRFSSSPGFAISESVHLLLRLFIFNGDVSDGETACRHTSGSMARGLEGGSEQGGRVQLSPTTLMCESGPTGPHGNIQ